MISQEDTTVTTVPFALYDGFTDTAFGGSQGAIVSDARGIDADTRLRIAREIGAPATGFVSSHDAHSVEIRFVSTVMELPMCGHGTICLMTHMMEQGLVEAGEATLRLPTTTATVELSHRHDGRALVMLDIQPPDFRHDQLDLGELAGLLGASDEIYSDTLPIETAVGDFVHLVVPIKNLDAMRRISPDFTGLTRFCSAAGLETIAVFCTDVEQSDHTIHVRDFCPAVGVAESAAAGTTNAALTGYLIRHGLVHANDKGKILVQAEQGHEINRPSSIRSVVTMEKDAISRLQVGGVATKILDGSLYLP